VATPTITRILDTLESRYGALAAFAPGDPYEFLIWWHSGYPASAARCEKGWQSLKHHIGIAPKQLMAASTAKLTNALKAGGMVPELRATRLKEIAARVQAEYSGDLCTALASLPAPQARKALKSFPGIGNPGADRILLFARLCPVAAVPSSCPHVLVRIAHGADDDKYPAQYAAAQRMLDELPASFDARIRAYLLINRHGGELCKRAHPACDRCPLQPVCIFAKRANKPQ
jgi:endonuclease III